MLWLYLLPLYSSLTHFCLRGLCSWKSASSFLIQGLLLSPWREELIFFCTVSCCFSSVLNLRHHLLRGPPWPQYWMLPDPCPAHHYPLYFLQRSDHYVSFTSCQSSPSRMHVPSEQGPHLSCLFTVFPMPGCVPGTWQVLDKGWPNECGAWPQSPPHPGWGTKRQGLRTFAFSMCPSIVYKEPTHILRLSQFVLLFMLQIRLYVSTLDRKTIL